VFFSSRAEPSFPSAFSPIWRFRDPVVADLSSVLYASAPFLAVSICFYSVVFSILGWFFFSLVYGDLLPFKPRKAPSPSPCITDEVPRSSLVPVFFFSSCFSPISSFFSLAIFCLSLHLFNAPHLSSLFGSFDGRRRWADFFTFLGFVRFCLLNAVLFFFPPEDFIFFFSPCLELLTWWRRR